MKSKKLLSATIALLFLVDVAISLSPAARASLTKAIPGVDLEALRERLQRIGEKDFPVKNGTATEVVDNSPTADLDAINTPSTDSGEPGIETINVREGVADYLFQGDIILSEEQLKETEANSGVQNSTRRKRQWANSLSARWTDNILYYSFAAGVPAKTKSVVKQALNYMQARSCVGFIENATAENRVEVFVGQGCYSALGMDGGVQKISLGNGCDSVGIAAHEFLHSLGSRHMHTRFDRDSYITVDTTNVPANRVAELGKAGDLVTENYTPYDYGSVMHYRATTFASKGYSLKPKIGRFRETEGSLFTSFYDTKMLNIYYKCHYICATSPYKCKNGGYNNPKNCMTCVCPAGYGGNFCDQRPAGCGETLTAVTAWKTKTFSFGAPKVATLRDNFMLCNHWVKAPAGKKIQIRVTALKGVQCGAGCRRNSIEPKYLADQGMVNPRICCSNLLNQVVTSALNPTPIVSYNRISMSTYTFQYRYI